jgi:hypothetical protein
MERYLGISSVAFGQTPLPLPLSVRVTRQVQLEPAAGDADLYATSVQLTRPTIAAEVRIRDTAAPEGMSLGQKADLSFTIAPAQSGAPGRRVTLSGAVLVAVELAYEQSSLATATLRFVCESQDGQTDPFAAEEAQ